MWIEAESAYEPILVFASEEEGSRAQGSDEVLWECSYIGGKPGTLGGLTALAVGLGAIVARPEEVVTKSGFSQGSKALLVCGVILLIPVVLVLSPILILILVMASGLRGQIRNTS